MRAPGTSGGSSRATSAHATGASRSASGIHSFGESVAREIATSNAFGVRAATASPRSRTRSVGPAERADHRAQERRRASRAAPTSVTTKSGRMSASARPGAPAPVPTSTTRTPFRCGSPACTASASMRSESSASVRAAVRSMRLFHSREQVEPPPERRARQPAFESRAIGLPSSPRRECGAVRTKRIIGRAVSLVRPSHQHASPRRRRLSFPSRSWSSGPSTRELNRDAHAGRRVDAPYFRVALPNDKSAVAMFVPGAASPRRSRRPRGHAAGRSSRCAISSPSAASTSRRSSPRTRRTAGSSSRISATTRSPTGSSRNPDDKRALYTQSRHRPRAGAEGARGAPRRAPSSRAARSTTSSSAGRSSTSASGASTRAASRCAEADAQAFGEIADRLAQAHRRAAAAASSIATTSRAT